jgi:hypothetical protein
MAIRVPTANGNDGANDDDAPFRCNGNDGIGDEVRGLRRSQLIPISLSLYEANSIINENINLPTIGNNGVMFKCELSHFGCVIGRFPQRL